MYIQKYELFEYFISSSHLDIISLELPACYLVSINLPFFHILTVDWRI